MDVMVVATDSLRALALEATLDLGGHRVVALVDSATAALDHARTSHPSLAIVHLGSRNWADMVSELRDRLSVPSLCSARTATGPPRIGPPPCLVREPCGSRLILRAVKVAAELCEGRRPRGRLPRQLEGFGRPPRQPRSGCKQPARAPSQQRDGSG